MTLTQAQYYSSWVPSRRNTRFLDFVHRLVFQKQHNVSEIETPSVLSRNDEEAPTQLRPIKGL